MNRLNIANFVRRHVAKGLLKKAVVEEGTGLPPINLLMEQLQNKCIIDLSADDIERNYLARLSFIRDTFEQNMEYLENAFGRSQTVSEKD